MTNQPDNKPLWRSWNIAGSTLVFEDNVRAFGPMIEVVEKAPALAEIERITANATNAIETLQQALAAKELECENLRRGIESYKCFSCGSFTHPIYPVNLMDEINKLTAQLAEAKSVIEELMSAIGPIDGTKSKRHGREFLAKLEQTK